MIYGLINLKLYNLDSCNKINELILLMKEHGCIEDFGVGIDFDSIGVVVGDIKGKDICKISEKHVYLDDGSYLPINKLNKKYINKIISIISDF